MFPSESDLTICFADVAYQLQQRFALRKLPIRNFGVSSHDELDARIGEADVLVISGLCRNEVAVRAPKLRFIQSVGAGTDQCHAEHDLAILDRLLALDPADASHTAALSTAAAPGSTCRLGISRPAGQVGSARMTTGNSSPFARCTVIIRTPSVPCSMTGASSACPGSASASMRSTNARNDDAPRRSNRRARSTIRRQLASACSPVGHIAIAACARTASSSIKVVCAIGRWLRPTWSRPNRARASATCWVVVGSSSLESTGCIGCSLRIRSSPCGAPSAASPRIAISPRYGAGTRLTARVPSLCI
jgi:hypothetical protein